MASDPAPSRIWRTYVTEIREEADAGAAAYRGSVAPAAANRRTAIILVTAALAMTSLNFGATSEPWWFVRLLELLGQDDAAGWGRRAFFESSNEQFNGLMFWGAVQVLSYVAIPVVAIKLMGERVGDFGMRVRGIFRQGTAYGILFVASLPFIVAASTTPAFQLKYPFYDLGPAEALWPNLWLWWVMYALQFVALEFFFRGFLVHGLKGQLGYMAVFVMIVPYNMIHFTKPVTEALAAILGGVVLGSLSLKTRSIWWGVALHIAVAGTMDVLALGKKGLLW